MLINDRRELAYVVTIDEIQPIPNYDRVEHARVNGWWVIVKKGQFNVGDTAIYIEVDSKVPEIEPFDFLAKRNYKVKTQKMCKVLSQGLLMSFSDFPTKFKINSCVNGHYFYEDNNKKVLYENTPLTDYLNIEYYEAVDNKRKAPTEDKFKKMSQRHPKIFKRKWARWLMRRNWGRNLMFFFFGKKKDTRKAWPAWVSKTDEERIQNIPHVLKDKTPKIVTEKIDGSSATYTMIKKGHKYQFYVCSRNVVQDTPDHECYYDSNIYWEMAYQYNIEEVLKGLIEDYNVDWVTIQGEIYGRSVQKRTYGLEVRDFAAFNLIMSDRGRFNTLQMKKILNSEGIPTVPVLYADFILPDTVEELLEMATGESVIDGELREGFVIRSLDGTHSFKAVSNEFLLKYHS